MGRPRKNAVVEAAKTEEVKVEAVVEEVKAEEPKKAVKKTAEKATKAAAKAKETVKKTKEKVEKKVAEKKAAKAKAVVKVQFAGSEFDVAEIVNKAVALAGKEVQVYIKPEDGKVYFVSAENSGDFDL